MSRLSARTAIFSIASLLVVASITIERVEAQNAATEDTATKQSVSSEAAEPSANSSSATPSSLNTKMELKALEQRVNELKEKVFRSKARLNLLKETVLHGAIAGSRAIISYRNEFGGSFRLSKIVVGLDGKQIFAKTDESGSLQDNPQIEIFNGSIVPGDHTLSVQLKLRGHGYGVFSYLKNYKFDVRSSHSFTAAEGRQLQLVMKGYEKGNFTTELKDRPAIKFESEIFKVGDAGEEAAAKKTE